MRAFAGAKGLRTTPETQPNTIIPLHKSLHLAQWCETATAPLVNTKPRLIQTEMRDSTLQEHVPAVLVSCGSVFYSQHPKLCNALGAQPLKPLPLSSLLAVGHMKLGGH